MFLQFTALHWHGLLKNNNEIKGIQDYVYPY